MDGYRALLIGNSTFPVDPQNLQDLNGPVKDVALLGAALTDRDVGLFDNDHVRLLVERPAGTVLQEIEAFFLEARRDDQLLLYYSGHGLLNERNQLYLAAADTRVDRLRSTAVSAAAISEMLDNASARTAVILLDCCHSGAFKGTIGPANLAGSGRYVLTSCRSGELANDADRRNGTSLFTQHLVDGLLGGVLDLDGDGTVDVDEVYRYVHQRLAETNRQIPQRRFDGSARTPALARRPLPLVPLPTVPTKGLGLDPAAPRTGPEDSPDPPATTAATGATAPPDEPAKAAVTARGASGPGAGPPTGPATPRRKRRLPAVGAWLARLGRRRLAVASAVMAGLVLCTVLAVVVLSGENQAPEPPPPDGPALLSQPKGIALDADGNLFIADSGNNRVVRVAADTGAATTVAGSELPRAIIDGELATDTSVKGPRFVATLPDGGFVVVDDESHVLSVGPDGKLTQVATEGRLGPADAKITGIVAAPDGRLYIATEERVFLLDPRASGNVGTVAGTENPGFSGDGDAASRAQLKVPTGLAISPQAEHLYIADCENSRLRRIDLATNVIVTVAGGGPAYEEGGRASEAGGLSCPQAVAVGPDGAVYINGDSQNVRKVAGQRIFTAAGPVEEPTVTEDGQPATQTSFSEIRGIAVDSKNRLYLSEGNRVRRVEEGGRVSTYA